jgi:ribosomal protein S18 acetylase RimI-like enzyme
MQTFLPYYLIETNRANEDDRDFIKVQFKAFNNGISPYHLHIRTHPPEPLDLFLRDDTQTIVGGLIASTYWSWLDIDKLWLHEALRQRGYGSQLLRRAEQLAIQRGCHSAYLSTFGFQARGFYEKYGYYVVGELSDYPPGTSYFWLRKDFQAEDAEHVT